MSKAGFILIRSIVKLCYGKTELIAQENVPEKNVVFVGNHSQIHGPIVAELYFPEKTFIWCIAEMMDKKEVSLYAYRDFWSQKPKVLRPFYKFLSKLIVPFSVCIFNHARTVPVYHDYRGITTFRRSIEHLDRGDSLLIFPEKDEPYNHVVNRFQENFVDLAKLYYKKTGKKVIFVPIYVAPKLKKVYIGKGTEYGPCVDFKEEKKRILSYLQREITRMATELPRHTVVPYRNISKKKYLTNFDVSEVPYEKTGR